VGAAVSVRELLDGAFLIPNNPKVSVLPLEASESTGTDAGFGCVSPDFTTVALPFPKSTSSSSDSVDRAETHKTQCHPMLMISENNQIQLMELQYINNVNTILHNVDINRKYQFLKVHTLHMCSRNVQCTANFSAS
jgi:hypothetical protein